MQCNYLDFKKKKEIKRKKKKSKTKSLFSNGNIDTKNWISQGCGRGQANKRLIREQIKDLADRRMTDTS